MNINFNNIPQELKVNGLWCVWKLTEQGKVPFNPVTGQLAKSNNRNTFNPYNIVLQHVQEYLWFDEQNRMMGGLGLGIFNGYSAIDIDHCRDSETGELSELAREIIEYTSSYTEISPSGTGIRIIFKTNSKINKETHYIHNSKIGLEIYISENTNKYVTITGNVLYPNDISEVDISYILEKYMRKKGKTNIIEGIQNVTNKRLLNAIRYDTKLKTLWESSAPGYGHDESERDLALCAKLAYYLEGNYNEISDAFISSPYYKSKDSLHKMKWDTEYRENTIKMAINSFYEIKNNQIEDFELSDTGNAHLFIERYRELIRYNIDNKRWMVYNGKFWQIDYNNHIKNLVEIVIEEMKQNALLETDEIKKKKINSNIKRALSSAGKEAMIKEAQHLQGIPVSNSDFDVEPYYFNCIDGIIDLRNGNILTHDRKYMISKYSDIKLSKEKPALFMKFLNRIFNYDSELISFLKRVLGYSLTGYTKEQSMFIFLGEGSNGKSLLLETIMRISGSYGATSNVDILLEKKNTGGGNMGEIARLNKIRCVVTEEADIGSKLNEGLIKSMTSGIGNIVARFLYGNEFEFTPIFKIFMATNHRPVIRGTDHGIWRRIKIIPFNVIIPDEEQDKDLSLKLVSEYGAILNWIIEGAIEWERFGLNTPSIVKDSITDYKKEMDLVRRWIVDNCELDFDFKENATTLFQDFSEYCRINKEYQMSMTLFGRNMGKKFEKRKIKNNQYYLGIKLRERNTEEKFAVTKIGGEYDEKEI